MNFIKSLIAATVALAAGTAGAAVVPFTGSLNGFTQLRTDGGATGVSAGDTLSGSGTESNPGFLTGPVSYSFDGFESFTGRVPRLSGGFDELFKNGTVTVTDGANTLLTLKALGQTGFMSATLVAGTAATSLFGQSFFEVIGGSLMSRFDTNAVNDSAAGVSGADFKFSVTFASRDNCVIVEGDPNAVIERCTGGSISINGAENRVPEPVSLALLGLGLIGVGATRRRSKAA